MEALASGARLGLMAGATVVTFCAIVIAALGVFVAILTIVDVIPPEDEKEQESEEKE